MTKKSILFAAIISVISFATLAAQETKDIIINGTSLNKVNIIPLTKHDDFTLVPQAAYEIENKGGSYWDFYIYHRRVHFFDRNEEEGESYAPNLRFVKLDDFYTPPKNDDENVKEVVYVKNQYGVFHVNEEKEIQYAYVKGTWHVVSIYLEKSGNKVIFYFAGDYGKSVVNSDTNEESLVCTNFHSDIISVIDGEMKLHDAYPYIDMNRNFHPIYNEQNEIVGMIALLGWQH